MTIRCKTFIVIGLTLISLLASLYAISSRVLLNGFAQVEESNTWDDTRRVRGAVDDTLEKLSSTASDWANWDDTYKFVIDRNERYARANLGASSISVLNVNLMVLALPSGEIVSGRGFDRSKGRLTPLPAGMVTHLHNEGLLPRDGRVGELRKGITLSPQGPMFVVSRPILTSEKKGPAHGTLIMGRYFDATELARLSALTRFSLILRLFNEPHLPTDFEQARRKLSVNEPFVIGVIDVNTIGGYLLLEDTSNKPALLLRLAAPRDIYREGLKSQNYLFGALVIVCLATSLVTYGLLQKLVLGRLESLIGEVRDLSSGVKESRRLSSFGSDELGVLAAAMNELLEAEQKAQHASLSSENRFRAFMDNSPTVAFMKDADGRYLYTNKTFEQYFHYRAEEVAGRDDTELWPAETAQKLRENDAMVLKSNRMTQVEEALPLAGGREAWFLSYKFPFRDSSGEQVLAGVSLDITERREIERLKSEFVSTVSHELRTPLTAIRGALGIIIGGISGQIPEQTRKLLELAYKNTERLGRLINDILDIEAIESGKMTVLLKPVPIMPVVESALELNSPYSNEFGVSFAIEQAEPDAEVYVDRDRLIQVLINLLANAAKFSPRGEAVTVRVARREGENGRPLIRVSVSNKGPEIPREFHSRIFNRFAQADSSDSRARGGTGLGLNISKAIVERFGGTIGFASDSELTTFFFDLPEYRDRHKEAASPSG